MSPQKSAFHFKQFVVHHDRSMKVGTDAVLLGAWVDVTGAHAALDIGTGSGIIALMLAQRSSPATRIDAVEMEEPAFIQATENIAGSPWPEKISVYHNAIQDFLPNRRYDLILSNPPYFNGSLLPTSRQRQQARHTTSLSYGELLTSVKRLLLTTGKFATILPTQEGEHFRSSAAEAGLYCARQLAFFPRRQKPQERWLMEFSSSPAPTVTDTLVLYGHGDEWTPEYKDLTGGFYLSSQGIHKT